MPTPLTRPWLTCAVNESRSRWCTADWRPSGSSSWSTIRDETLLLAGRAHHLRRWELPRDSYPVGRAGYLRWRRDQKARHATDVAAILEACGYETSEIEDVQRLIRRESVDGAQAVEDAACLVFIETQLASLANRMDHDLLVEVIRKTARKMSDRGLELVASIPLGEAEQSLLSRGSRRFTVTRLRRQE